MKTTLKFVGWIILFVITITQSGFAQTFKYPEANIEKLQDGFQFVEGPIWKDGVFYFSDTKGNTVYKWTQDSGAVAYVPSAGNPNGLAFDTEGRLIICQHGPRQISRREEDGTLTPIATHYKGKRLNSPNDLTFKSDGSLFFTDPPFGLNDQHGTSETGWAGVFRLSTTGEVQLLDSTLSLPNGLVFSADESKLYVNDSQKRIIYVWDVVDDSTLANKRVFSTIIPFGYADGMEMDSEGNLYSAGPLGVWVFDSTGTVIDTIRITEANPSNCAWGDEDGKTLYITAGSAVYRVTPKESGSTGYIEMPELNKSFELFNNYPNPFNPSTTIKFSIMESGKYTLKVYDLLKQEVATLVDDNLSTGLHKVNFDASELASGAYMYQLSGMNKQIVKKMILMK